MIRLDIERATLNMWLHPRTHTRLHAQLRTRSHAYSSRCVLAPMRILPHAYSLPCVLLPMRTRSHAYSCQCVLAPMRIFPHAYSLPCVLFPMRNANYHALWELHIIDSSVQALIVCTEALLQDIFLRASWHKGVTFILSLAIYMGSHITKE